MVRNPLLQTIPGLTFSYHLLKISFVGHSLTLLPKNSSITTGWVSIHFLTGSYSFVHMLLLDRILEMFCKQERGNSCAKFLTDLEPQELPPVICVKVSHFVPRLELKPNLRGSGNGSPLQIHLWGDFKNG